MCVHLNSMPDDCLLAIFDLMPLCDLIQLNRVCLRWAKLLPSVCARRRTLALILSPRDLSKRIFYIPFNSHFNISFSGVKPFYDLPAAERESSLALPFTVPAPTEPNVSFDQFLLDGGTGGFFDIFYRNSIDSPPVAVTTTEMTRLSGELVTYLTEQFPNIDKLLVIHSRCDEDELYALVDLLGFWSLTNLKLWIRTWALDEKCDSNPHPIGTLLQGLNQQACLQKLTLDISGSRDIREITFPLEYYSFIAPLKEAKLILGNYGKRNLIWDIVRHYDSPNLRYISLGNPWDVSLQMALNPIFEFTTKVRQVYTKLPLSFETVGQFGEFCWRYCSLTSLQMVWSPHTTFSQLVTNLAVLSQLTHLKLDIFFPNHPANIFELVDRVHGDKAESRPISLAQVKILELRIVKCSHFQFESLSPSVFTSVAVIILEDYPLCSTCVDDPPPLFPSPYQAQMRNRCHRLVVCSFKNKFSNSLVQLYANNGDYDRTYVDWSSYVPNEDDLAVFGQRSTDGLPASDKA